ncbi:hypothetical protein ACFQ8T_19810 [Isoptericola sp. NPDC056618]|uniref:hypothetical protein n=1 Tax=Isoptericola sp. NPDC056618 TaxID=3345878 RepID=UPI0036CDA642
MRGRRHVVGADRALLTLLGLVLLVAGVGLVALASGWVPAGAGMPGPGEEVAVPAMAAAPDAPWWPAACAVAAVVMVVVGLWWLLAHRPGPRTTSMPLPGSRTRDRLRVVPDAVTRAATAELDDDPRVRSAALGLAEEHGRLVLVGRVRVAPRTDVTAVGTLVDGVAHRTAQVLGRDLSGRVHLAVARRGSAERHVE